MFTKRLATAATLLVASVLTAAPAAAGGGTSVTRPFHASYTTEAAEPTHSCDVGQPTRSVGTGTGTHLGRFEIEVVGCIDLFTLTGSGVASYTAANGDTLDITFSGEATIDVVAGTLTFVSEADGTAGTGRFANAEVTGPGQAIDVASLADGAAIGEVTGRITFNAADRSN